MPFSVPFSVWGAIVGGVLGLGLWAYLHPACPDCGYRLWDHDRTPFGTPVRSCRQCGHAEED